MIRYLKQEEMYKAREMYQQNFPEDTEGFVSYYFTEKTKDNRILVMEEEQLQVMVHLNPYKLSVFGERLDANYIVAVATDPSVRRQGKMKQVLKTAMDDMKAMGHPFTFLLPAVDPKVYISCGFFFIENENYQELQKETLRAASIEKEVTLRPATEKDLEQLVLFSNDFLKIHYDVFIVRDVEYYRRKMAELACQDGYIMLLENADGLQGYFTYGLDEQVELQEILVKEDIQPDFMEIVRYFEGISVVISNMNYMVCPLEETMSQKYENARFHLREWV